MWPLIVAFVFTVWACVSVLTGRVARSHRLAHVAYVPLLWMGCLSLVTANPLLPIAWLVIGLPCGWVIYRDHLRVRHAKK